MDGIDQDRDKKLDMVIEKIHNKSFFFVLFSLRTAYREVASVNESLQILSGPIEQSVEPSAEVSAKHVTLIRPAMVSPVGSWTSPVTPPLGIAYLAAVLREAGISVSCIDSIGEKVDQFHQDDHYFYQGLTDEEIVDRIPTHTDCIGVTCMFSQDWPYIRGLLSKIREHFPAAKIVVGGEHITALPEFCLRDCKAIDYCVLGEGEETIVDLARCFYSPELLQRTAGLAFLSETNEFIKTKPRERIRAVGQLPYPAWDLFPMESFIETRNGHGVFRGRSMGIIASRGCPYKCTFCSNPIMYGKAYISRTPNDVLDEIEHYIKTFRATNIDFYDLTMILKKSWIIEFCREIERRGLKFTWQLPTGTRSEVIDDEVAIWLRKTGCCNITYAPESGDPETLEKIKKKVDLATLTNSIRSSLRAGINVKCNIIIGFPEETRKNVVRTILFCLKLAVIGVHDVGVFLFSPYPGSQLFDDLQADGMIPKTLDNEYFYSLSYMDSKSVKAFCKKVSGAELAVWRFIGMSLFFAISYCVRPWRFVQFIRNVWKYESNTVLEQRVGAIVNRLRTKNKNLEPSRTSVTVAH